MELDPITDEEQKAVRDLAVKRRNFATPEALDAFMQFKSRPTDVVISTSAKSGTTWVSQICHQLRTGASGGHMDFKEITEVVPYVDVALDLGLNCDDDQVAVPRVFKSHMNAGAWDRPGKFITVMRHPYDVALSHFKFLRGWMFEPDTISPNVFIQQVWLRSSGWPSTEAEDAPNFRFCMSWWCRRHEDNVLIVFYEDMKENLEREVRRIAEFIGVTDPDAIRVAVERSTYQYMYDHRTQFDDGLVKSKRNKAMGLSADAGSSHGKVASGGGNRHLLSATTRSLMDQAWKKICQPLTDAENYDEWLAMWRKESGTCM